MQQLSKALCLLTDLENLIVDLSFSNIQDTDVFLLMDAIKKLKAISSLALFFRFSQINDNGSSLILSLLLG